MRKTILLAGVLVLFMTIGGCSSVEQSANTQEETAVTEASGTTVEEAQTFQEPASGMKTIYLYVQDEVCEVYVNDEYMSIMYDNMIEVDTSAPVVVRYSYFQTPGVMTETFVELDTYYTYFVLKNSGRYSQDTSKDTYEAEKTRD